MHSRSPLAPLCLTFAASLFAACGTTPGSEGSRGPGAQLAPLAPNAQDPLETIARYEDARIDGDGLLQALLHKGSTATPARLPTDSGKSTSTSLLTTVGMIQYKDVVRSA